MKSINVKRQRHWSVILLQEPGDYTTRCYFCSTNTFIFVWCIKQGNAVLIGVIQAVFSKSDEKVGKGSSGKVLIHPSKYRLRSGPNSIFEQNYGYFGTTKFFLCIYIQFWIRITFVSIKIQLAQKIGTPLSMLYYRVAQDVTHTPVHCTKWSTIEQVNEGLTQVMLWVSFFKYDHSRFSLFWNEFI